MRELKTYSSPDGGLLAEYSSRIGEALLRRRAETEIHAARAEAEIAIKARSEFLANMNHELRTPLNAIIGFGTMLRNDEEYEFDEEQKRGYLDYILQSADLLLGHINTLLEVAALESGSVEVRDEEIDLGVVLDKSLERTKIFLDSNKVVVERRDEGADIHAWGDAERTGQAVDHLIQAAAKACGEGGRVLIRANVDENGWPEIAIRDDSNGLSPEEISEALEAFNEVHHGLDRSFSGPGIGYAIAKTFIEMQGGRFRIKSRKGHGTLVRISLMTVEEGREASLREAEKTTINMEKANDAA